MYFIKSVTFQLVENFQKNSSLIFSYSRLFFTISALNKLFWKWFEVLMRHQSSMMYQNQAIIFKFALQQAAEETDASKSNHSTLSKNGSISVSNKFLTPKKSWIFFGFRELLLSKTKFLKKKILFLNQRSIKISYW